jgi:hypothetical protein
MKKEMNPVVITGRKLRLSKKTISNLAAPATNNNNFWEIAPTRGGCFTHRCPSF